MGNYGKAGFDVDFVKIDAASMKLHMQLNNEAKKEIYSLRQKK